MFEMCVVTGCYVLMMLKRWSCTNRYCVHNVHEVRVVFFTQMKCQQSGYPLVILHSTHYIYS